LIIIEIEIKKRSRIKEFFRKLNNRLEDLFFKLIMKLPDNIIPTVLMEWLDRYTTKRINQLKQESIKTTWKILYLEKTLDDISKQQQS
jgi:hypothetical protein